MLGCQQREKPENSGLRLKLGTNLRDDSLDSVCVVGACELVGQLPDQPAEMNFEVLRLLDALRRVILDLLCRLRGPGQTSVFPDTGYGRDATRRWLVASMGSPGVGRMDFFLT